jgi:E3 ubiquitin-protein ligase TRIP12
MVLALGNVLSQKSVFALQNGVQAVLNYIEFFGAPAQRNALLITSSCCSNLSTEEFEFIQPILPLLSQRITQDNDKKCVEHTCVAFSRIVDCFHTDPDRLREIASHGLLPNIQLLLTASPPIFGSQTFIMVLQMLTHICTACPDLAAHLLQNRGSSLEPLLNKGMAFFLFFFSRSDGNTCFSPHWLNHGR